MNYLSIDPGVVTGVSLLSEDLKIIDTLILDIKELGIEGTADRIQKLWSDGLSYKEDIQVICESFTLWAHEARRTALHDPQLYTVQLIGALKVMFGEDNIVFQPSAMKSGCPDEELKRLGLWLKTGGPLKRHVLDSIRHTVVYSRRHK